MCLKKLHETESTTKMSTDKDDFTVLPIHPGDNILVAMRDTGLDIDANEIRDTLIERFPGVNFTIVIGASGIGKLEL